MITVTSNMDSQNVSVSSNIATVNMTNSTIENQQQIMAGEWPNVISNDVTPQFEERVSNLETNINGGIIF